MARTDDSSPAAALEPTAPAGQLALLSACAALLDGIPIPILPARLLVQLRGSVAQSVASRHGLSLSSEARAVLAGDVPYDEVLLRKAGRFLVGRVLRCLGPLGLVQAGRHGLEVYALGHLFDRWIRTARTPGPLRVHGDEARTVQSLVEGALKRVASPAIRPALPGQGGSAEDLRDGFTRRLDELVLAGASLPAYLERRLEAAFDVEVELWRAREAR